MAKKAIHRGGVLNCRVPSKTRYGAELLCRKYSASLATVVERAMDSLFEEEGLSVRKKGQLLSLLEKLWSDSEAERILRLAEHAPELLSSDERWILGRVDQIQKHNGSIMTPEEFDAALPGIRDELEDSKAWELEEDKKIK